MEQKPLPDSIIDQMLLDVETELNIHSDYHTGEWRTPMVSNKARLDVAKSIAEIIRKIHPEAVIEVSGGINPDNIARYADFADVISLGWLTHSVKAVDFSMEFC